MNLSSGAVNSHRLLCSQMFVLKLSCKQNKSVSDFVFKVKNFLHTLLNLVRWIQHEIITLNNYYLQNPIIFQTYWMHLILY